MATHIRSAARVPADRPGRILAIDYGRKRIGLAVSDQSRTLARPLATLARKNRDADLRRLRQVIREQSVTSIIVGLPLNMDGTAGPMAAEAERFAVRLAKHSRLPVELVDERLTSWEAGQTLAETRPPGRRAELDPVAAAVLLRGYLSAVSGHPRAGC